MFGRAIPWVLTSATGVVMFWLASLQMEVRGDSVYGWSDSFDASVLSRAGAADVVLMWVDQQWWRAFTACFIHGGWLHWLVNVVTLHALWPWCVAAIGGGRSSLALLFGGAFGAVASIYAGEGGVVAGLSGGLFALAAVVVYERAGVCEEIRRQVVVSVVVCAGIGIALPFVWPSGPRLANIGHAAGWLVGGMWAISAGAGGKKAWFDWRVRAQLGVIVLLAGTAEYGHRTSFNEVCGLHLLQLERPVQAVQFLELAHREEPYSSQRSNALAYALALAGDRLTTAASLSDSALEQEPENSSYLDTRGWIYCRAGDPVRGMRLLQRAVERTNERDGAINEHLQRCVDASSGVDAVVD